MDPVSVFSMVSGVISVLDFSKEAIVICQELVKDGSLSKHNSLQKMADSLDSAIVELDGPLDDCPSGSSREDKVLVDLCHKCRDTASVIRRQLIKLKRDGGILDAIKKTIQTMRKSEFIENKKKELDGYERVLNTRILVRLDTRAVQQMQVFDRLLERMNQLSIGAQDEKAKHEDQHLSQFYETVMESLKFPEIFSRQEQILDAYRTTYEWIFQSSEDLSPQYPSKWANFMDWLTASTGSTYWIHGKAGSGKSTLMSFIEQDDRTAHALRAWAGSTSTLLTPSFYFWETGTDMQKSVKGLLQSLLCQILGKYPGFLKMANIAPFRALNASLKSELSSSHAPQVWTERRLSTSLTRIMEASKNTEIYFCFFIDGLDEFIGDTDVLRDLVKAWSSYPNTKVCVSSRPEQAFFRYFEGVPQLRLQDLTSRDIEFYINDRLGSELVDIQQECHQCRAGSSFPHRGLCASDLINEVVSKASGVFLWVKIVTQQLLGGLRDGDDLSELYTRLGELPGDVERLYGHMMAKLPSSYLSEATKYFEVLIASQLGRDSPGVTLLHMSLASEASWNNVKRGNRVYFESNSFRSQCTRLASRVLSRCAGLVQVGDSLATDDLAIMDRWIRSASRSVKIKKQLHPGYIDFREVNFIHKSVFEFFCYWNDSTLKLSHANGLLSLARAQLGIGFLFGRIFLRENYPKYGRISGYAGFQMELLSLLEAEVTTQSLSDSMIESIDELIGLTVPMLDSLHNKLNPHESSSWREHCDPEVLSLRTMVVFSDEEFVGSEFSPRLHDELSLWAFFGLLRALQKAFTLGEVIIDWNHILSCIVYGSMQIRSAHMLESPPEALYDAIHHCLAHGAELKNQIKSRRWLDVHEHYDPGGECEITVALTNLTALLSQLTPYTLWSRHFKLIDSLVSDDEALGSTLWSFLTPSAWELGPHLGGDPRSLEEVAHDLIVREVSIPQLLRCFTKHDHHEEIEDIDPALCISKLNSLISEEGIPLSNRISFYGCCDSKNVEDRYHYPPITFYRLDEDQCNLMNSMEWLPIYDFSPVACQDQIQHKTAFSVDYKWEDGVPKKWSVAQVETTITTLQRVRNSLREDQIIGRTRSAKFVLGDESTYVSHKPDKTAETTS